MGRRVGGFSVGIRVGLAVGNELVGVREGWDDAGANVGAFVENTGVGAFTHRGVQVR